MRSPRPDTRAWFSPGRACGCNWVLTCLAVVGFFWLPPVEAPAFLAINEIMYHPPDGKDTLEFIELFNDAPTTREIAGWKFTKGIDFTFAAGTSIPAHGYVVVCADPDAVRRTYGISNVAGPYAGKLDNAGEVVELRNQTGGLIDRVDYQDEPPWPAAADGTGHSLSLVDPLSENERAASWTISNSMGGTPGRANFSEPARRPSVRINEVLCQSSGETWVELFNPTTTTVDLSDCFLSDDAGKLTKFVIPNSTAIDPGGFRLFTEKEIGFALSPKRRKVFLCAPQARFVIDATAYRETALDQSIGRWPDGADAWHRMPQPSPAAPNTVALNTAVVINEIMYHPFSERDEAEYVELYNRGRSPVDLAGWEFTHGIEFGFPKGTILPPGGYLVVAKDKTFITAEYGIDNCLGDFDKRLSNDSDRLVLRDALGNVADEVRYYDGGRWPEWADGGGSSLELIDPRQDNAYPAAWAASDESAKARWTRFEYTKPHGDGNSEFHVFLADKGIVLIDDVRLYRDGTNYIANGTFDSDTNRWVITGTHKYSDRYTSDSHSGPACLRIVAVGRGTTGIDRIKTYTSGTLKTTGTYTVSYWAKWQAGNHRLCTRTHGHGVAQTNAIPVPGALGTPGRQNSRFRSNAGPIIADVRHWPVVPTSGTAVAVSARILDADAVASATVWWRRDGWTTWTMAAMHDDGRHGDGAAEDRRYGASMPVQPAASLVEFYVEAVDAQGAGQTFPNAAPRRTCLYRVRGPKRRESQLKMFDLLLRTETYNGLLGRAFGEDRMDNELLDATLVLNEDRAFYNVGVRYAGSPWTRPSRGRRGIFSRRVRRPMLRIRFNEDERLFGLKSAQFDSQNVDPTRVHERMFFWLVGRLGGVPFGRREYVGMMQNGLWEGVYELVQRLDAGFLEDYYPDGDDGELYKVNTSYEWTGRKFTYDRPRMYYRGPDKENYRFHFEKRSREKEDDFSSVIELCRLFDAEQTDEAQFVAGMQAQLHLDEWMRSLACQAVAGDWDGFGFVTGKNARLYRRSDTERWILLPWDKDLTWGNSKLPVFSPSDPGVARLLEWPAFRRMYLGYMEELLQETFTTKTVAPRIDALYTLLHAEGDNAMAPGSINTFVDRRRTWLFENALPKPVDFAITTHGGDDVSTAARTISLQGTAPLWVRTVNLNGEPAQVRWIDVTTWEIGPLELQPGPNRFALTAAPAPEGAKAAAEITVTRR